MVQTFVCGDIVRSSCGWTELSTHVTFGRHLALISGNTQKKLNDYYLFSIFFLIWFVLVCYFVVWVENLCLGLICIRVVCCSFFFAVSSICTNIISVILIHDFGHKRYEAWKVYGVSSKIHLIVLHENSVPLLELDISTQFKWYTPVRNAYIYYCQANWGGKLFSIPW